MRVTEKALDLLAITLNDERSKSDDESDAMDGSVVAKNLRERRKKRRVFSYAAQFRGEKDRFGAVLKKSDEAQRELEKRKLAVEGRKLQAEERMHAADRYDRGRGRNDEREGKGQKRVSQERLEMEKVKVLMNMTSNLRKWLEICRRFYRQGSRRRPRLDDERAQSRRKRRKTE